MESTQVTKDNPNLRMQDLIAKTAGVSLKDTIRVILAVEAVHYSVEEKGPALGFVGTLCPDRPSPENVAACEQASFDLKEGDTPHRTLIDFAMAQIRRLS